jgi:iron(II)-dependent oxidoreductase
VNPQARKDQLCRSLERTRSKTLRLLDRIPDDLLKIRVHDFYSPIGWHFGHIGMTEEYWALTQALGRPPRDPHYAFLFANIPANPKDKRVYLPERDEIRAYLTATREDALRALAETDLDTDDPLLADGYAWDFALQHECQHQETIAELLQLLCRHTTQPTQADGGFDSGLNIDASAVRNVGSPAETVAIPGGAFVMGSDDRHGYDNEKRAHAVTVAPFGLDRRPVTAAEWTQFIDDGGYRRPELWTEAGWRWRENECAERPEYWFVHGDGYGYYGPLGVRAIDPLEPVTSLSWFEADAYARWRGKRLPTEAEWEFAAAFDPVAGRSRLFPWGDEPLDETEGADADCDLRHLGPQTVAAVFNRTVSGIEDMAGKIWEWTSTPFLPYPGFVAFPYDGYSKDHMDGAHYVCRGGSWATDPRILRCSFRNWYVPTYRQGFLGLRLASDL